LQLYQRLSHDRDRPSRTHVQDILSARPPPRQSHDDIFWFKFVRSLYTVSSHNFLRFSFLPPELSGGHANF
jgi:hypothetical protein